jgi:hypothetical protein
MRKTHSFKIEGYDQSFTVYELTIRQIIDLMQDEKISENLSLNAFKEFFGDTILPAVSNVSINDLLDMAPSDIKIIWDKFQEANSVFFGAARQLGLEEVLNNLRRAITEDFSKLLVPSSNVDTSSS